MYRYYCFTVHYIKLKHKWYKLSKKTSKVEKCFCQYIADKSVNEL